MLASFAFSVNNLPRFLIKKNHLSCFPSFSDKKAYEQYLEARRAKKWGRNPHVDPVDYIPMKYRSEKQIKERQAKKESESK